MRTDAVTPKSRVTVRANAQRRHPMISKQDADAYCSIAVENVENGSQKLHQAARDLSQSIVTLEKWLGTLRGKQPVTVWDLPTPFYTDAGEIQGTERFGLRLQRLRDNWLLFYSRLEDKEDTADADWSVLSRSGLETKVRCSKLFEPLLQKLHDSQTKRFEEISQASLIANSLASAIASRTNGEAK